MSATSPNGTNALPAGRHLGAWELQEQVGAGGTASVYRALYRGHIGEAAGGHDPAAYPSEAAVRVSRPVNAAHRSAIFSTYRSLPAHPNVIRVHDLFELDLDGAPHIICVTELAEGPTLQDRLRSTLMTEDEATDLAGDLIDGLDAFHRHGLVHGDVKPANVMWFGQSWKLVDPSATEPYLDTPQTSAVISHERTLSYVPPELLDTPGRTRRAGDVWALGVTIYEATVGGNPFPSMTDQVLCQARTSSVPWPELRSVIERCLTPIEHRAKTAAELRQSLAKRRTLPSIPTVSAGRGNGNGRVPGWRGPIGILALLAGLAGVLFVVSNRFDSATQPESEVAKPADETPQETDNLDSESSQSGSEASESGSETPTTPTDTSTLSVVAETRLDFEDDLQLQQLVNLTTPGEKAATIEQTESSNVLAISSGNTTTPYLIADADGDALTARTRVSMSADLRLMYDTQNQLRPVGSTSGFVLKTFTEASEPSNDAFDDAATSLPDGYEVMVEPSEDGIALWIGAIKNLATGVATYQLLGTDDGHAEAQRWLVRSIDFTDAPDQLDLGFWQLQAELDVAADATITASLIAPDGERFEFTWVDDGPSASLPTDAGAVGINNYGYYSIDNLYDNIEIALE